MLVMSFIDWIKHNNDFFNKRNIKIDYIKKSTIEDPTQFAVVDFVTNEYIGRISIWEKGFVDLEVLEIETELQIYYLHIELNSNKNIIWDETLNDFFEKLINQ